MIIICSKAEVHKFMNAKQNLLAINDAELMDAIANVQRIMIVNSGSLNWTSYIDCSVTPVGYACLFSVYSYMLALTSVIVMCKDLYCN